MKRNVTTVKELLEHHRDMVNNMSIDEVNDKSIEVNSVDISKVGVVVIHIDIKEIGFFFDVDIDKLHKDGIMIVCNGDPAEKYKKYIIEYIERAKLYYKP